MTSCTKNSHCTKNCFRLLGLNGRSNKERKLQSTVRPENIDLSRKLHSAVRPENINRLRKLHSSVRHENIDRLRTLHNAVGKENIDRLRTLHSAVRQENIGRLRTVKSTVRQEMSNFNRIESIDYRNWKFDTFKTKLNTGNDTVTNGPMSYHHIVSNYTNE